MTKCEDDLTKLQEAVRKLERGCDCEYDYRCTRCDNLVAAQGLVKTQTKEQRDETVHEG